MSLALPKAILFDHDGVLAKSEPLHWRAWGLLLQEMGLPFDEGVIRSQVGRTGPEILGHVLDLHRPGWTPSEYPLDELVHRKNVHYLSRVPAELKAYDGVPELLRWLKGQGIGRVVVSNARRRELVTALDALELTPLFDCVLSRDDLSAPKPDPMAYLTGAAMAGQEPTDCWAVEDSPAGIESALLGGIPSVAVLTNYSDAAMRTPVPGRPDLKPALILADVTGLLPVLQRLAAH